MSRINICDNFCCQAVHTVAISENQSWMFATLVYFFVDKPGFCSNITSFGHIQLQGCDSTLDAWNMCNGIVDCKDGADEDITQCSRRIPCDPNDLSLGMYDERFRFALILKFSLERFYCGKSLLEVKYYPLVDWYQKYCYRHSFFGTGIYKNVLLHLVELSQLAKMLLFYNSPVESRSTESHWFHFWLLLKKQKSLKTRGFLYTMSGSQNPQFLCLPLCPLVVSVKTLQRSQRPN